MTIEGVDYSWGRPGGAALAKAGKAFACRYLAYHYYSPLTGHTYDDAGKGLSRTELADLFTYGISVVLNFEVTAARMKLGAKAGAEDAPQVLAALAALRVPDAIPVYFSADWDATSADYPAIDGYLNAVASVLGRARVGIYGEKSVIDHCRSAGTARWFWQTYAWSGGLTASGIHLKQYLNGQKINGAAVDLDRAYQANYGQWASSNAAPESDTETPVGLNLNLDATHDTSPLDAFGTAKIVGTGHYAIRVSDAKGTPIADGTNLGVVQKGVVIDALGSSFSAGEPCVVYNLSGELYCSPTRDISFTALPVPADATPFSQADVDKAVAAATAPLDAALKDAQAAVATATQAGIDQEKADIRSRLGL